MSGIICRFKDLTSDDVNRVGGKNASLGEMIRTLKSEGIRIPGGFATTAEAYRRFVAENNLAESIRARLEEWNNGKIPLSRCGREIRSLFTDSAFPEEVRAEIREAYAALSTAEGEEDVPVAVRSSATAEDLPEASFAGQQETFLNVRGKADVVDAARRCYASLFTDRAISYREKHGFDHMKIALSVGVQLMVRADTGASGVMFSIDTETGFPRAVLINAAWGLGEPVVQGRVDPDEYRVFKPALNTPGLTPILEKKRGRKSVKMTYAEEGDAKTRLEETKRKERETLVLEDSDILTLARWADIIGTHYATPMDMEWAKDGETGELFILQARPETVQSRRKGASLKTYRIKEKGRKLAEGNSVGQAITTGQAVRMKSPEDVERFPDNGILVTPMTDPDWVPVMKRARAIVTDHGGRTSHAAIVSRELGVPAIVGTGNATENLEDDSKITVSCAEGDVGYVYEGEATYEEKEISLEEIPQTKAEVMLNVANPDAALRWWRLPADGVGLARMEFIINNTIKAHPLALLHPEKLEASQKDRIRKLTRHYDSNEAFFVDNLARGIARIAAPSHPRPVIVRMSDFKTNEYADLMGGQAFEPAEENPMLGWRGASRYTSPAYREGFAMECAAIRKAREEIGLDNIKIMIPFCRTPEEADNVLSICAQNGLERGKNGLEIYVMCEIPSNVVLAETFAEKFDGFSIGSNDLTQLTLGVDRDSDALSHLFNEDDPAVKSMIRMILEKAHGKGCKVSLCGQAPSDNPVFAGFLAENAIDAVSVTPDSFLEVKQHIKKAEK